MAVTLTDQFGGTSTPTLDSGSDNCDYVIVVGNGYLERYTKIGATSYQYASRTNGTSGYTVGQIIGVSYSDGGGSGSLSGLTPTLGVVPIGDGSEFVARELVIADLSDVGDAISADDKHFLVWSGDTSTGDWTNRTPAQSRSDIGLSAAAICYHDSAPVTGTVVLCQYMPYAGTIDSLVHKSASGSVTANLTINGSSVTSISAVTVDSSETTTAATGANTFSIGDTIAVAFSSGSSPVDVDLVVLITR